MYKEIVHGKSNFLASWSGVSFLFSFFLLFSFFPHKHRGNHHYLRTGNPERTAWSKKKKTKKKKKKTTEVNKPHQKRYVGLIKMRLTLLFTANAGNHGSFSTVFCHSFGFGFWVCQSWWISIEKKKKKNKNKKGLVGIKSLFPQAIVEKKKKKPKGRCVKISLSSSCVFGHTLSRDNVYV